MTTVIIILYLLLAIDSATACRFAYRGGHAGLARCYGANAAIHVALALVHVACRLGMP